MTSRVLFGCADNMEGTINNDSLILISVYHNNSFAWTDSGSPSHWGLFPCSFPPVSGEALDHPFEHLSEYPPANRVIISVTGTQFSFDVTARYVYDDWDGRVETILQETIHVPASPLGETRHDMTFGDYSAFPAWLPVLGLAVIPVIILIARARK